MRKRVTRSSSLAADPQQALKKQKVIQIDSSSEEELEVPTLEVVPLPTPISPGEEEIPAPRVVAAPREVVAPSSTIILLDSSSSEEDLPEPASEGELEEPIPEEEEEEEEEEEMLVAVSEDSVASLFSGQTEREEKRDFQRLKVKRNYGLGSIYVLPNRRIYLESFSPLYQQAAEFLIAIAEPRSRLRTIHEYEITDFSLHAAISIGLSATKIVQVLERLSKTEIPIEIQEFILKSTDSYGKLSLVLRQNRYFLESQDKQILEQVKEQPNIKKAHLISECCDPQSGFFLSDPVLSVPTPSFDISDEEEMKRAEEPEEPVYTTSFCFEVDRQYINAVKEDCLKMGMAAVEEYDYAVDQLSSIPHIPIHLKPSTALRPFQEKSLFKMFGNGRARSGIIVLPCGAGKTLVGVTATCTLMRRTLVLTTNAVAVEQWKQQYMMWSTIDSTRITTFTAQTRKGAITSHTDIIVTTYNMLSHSGKRSEAATELITFIKQSEWGLLILDEVHVTPARTFREVVKICAARCKLGLTATLVREDDKIEDLNFLIGSKLYEANWLDLANAGYIANVSCTEVWCEMTNEFFREWLSPSLSIQKQRQLSIMNPNKFRACESLIRHHESLNHKIIVFSDDVFALKHYANALGKVYMYGGTRSEERNSILGQFKHSDSVKTIFISRIGDNAIDIPDANVLIQISSHFGARRQEAQRLGRILRAKEKTKSTYNAFFYTLISKYTEEMAYSSKRRRFLVNQGYAYHIQTEIQQPKEGDAKLHYESKEDQLRLLSIVLAASYEKDVPVTVSAIPVHVKRKVGRAGSLSGSTGRIYSNSNNLFEMQTKPSILPPRRPY